MNFAPTLPVIFFELLRFRDREREKEERERVSVTFLFCRRREKNVPKAQNCPKNHAKSDGKARRYKKRDDDDDDKQKRSSKAHLSTISARTEAKTKRPAACTRRTNESSVCLVPIYTPSWRFGRRPRISRARSTRPCHRWRLNRRRAKHSWC
jgi:hypothetical protein